VDNSLYALNKTRLESTPFLTRTFVKKLPSFYRRVNRAYLDADFALRAFIIINHGPVIHHADCYNRAEVDAAAAAGAYITIYFYHYFFSCRVSC